MAAEETVGIEEAAILLMTVGEEQAAEVFKFLSPKEVQKLGDIGIRWVLSRGDVAGASRVAGPPPPAVGVYEVPNARPVPLPPNAAPAGLILGLVVSALALLAAAGWLRLYTIESPPAKRS